MARLITTSLVLALVGGCAHAPLRHDDRHAAVTAPDYSLQLTPFDVPVPTNVPFDDEAMIREYLTFFHRAYLGTTNDSNYGGGSSISPISPFLDAAVAGHNDGQEAAMRLKQTVWGERFGPGPIVVGRAIEGND